MTVKQTIMTFAVTTMMGLTLATTTANADAVDKTSEIANETTQVANDIKDSVSNDGLIETIDKNRGNIESMVNKGGEFAYKFSDKLDDAVNYNKETNNKNIFTKTSNFVSILFTEKTKEQVLNEEKQDKSIVETAKEQVANDDLQSSAKQAIEYQFNKTSGFSSIPSGLAGFLVIGIRVLIAIIVITSFAIAIRFNKSSKDRDYAKYQRQLSRLR
ncbi:hypothetical protein [Enterococcus faecalis]|uniref:hypothetical protein n=1 Tax=Enterococcus faecalis TaxID=1351 RepID=UPI00155EA0B6|nr:hypothetical protein [Enterococcus faecalis]MDT2124375.1 hypothetical protein [Enterococcus faecalis]NRC71508.1 hypothetical protein [Enterococcus faecalis]